VIKLKERMLTKEEKETYLDAVSEEVFRTQFENLTKKQAKVLKLSLYLRQIHGEFDESTYQQLVSAM